MAKTTDFDSTFAELKEIFGPYGARLNVTVDTADNYGLETKLFDELRKLTEVGLARFTSKKFYSQF